MLNAIIALISGILFGTGMIVSNMVDPTKVIGFLDITGQWDPSLAVVIIGALAVFTPCYHFFIKQRSHAINGKEFNWAKNTKVDGKLLSGATIFGIGWGLVGICPGPAISSIGGGSMSTYLFVASMLCGMAIANTNININIFNKKCSS